MITRRSVIGMVGLGAAASLPGARAQDGPYSRAAENAIELAAAKEGALTLLMQTSVSSETMGEMVKGFNRHYPLINIGYTIQGTIQVMNRFTAELNAKKGVTDCLMLPSNLAETDNYIRSGAIARYTTLQDGAFPGAAKRSGLWYAWARECAVTVYRKGALSGEEKRLIRTYTGLGDPRFKGRLGINGINNSVTLTGAYVLLNQPDQGIWQRLTANKPRAKASTPALMDGLLSGEYDVALFAAWGSAATPARNGAPIEFGNTALTPILYVPGGISALAPHPNAAKLWQDWVLSKEGQDLWASVVGSNSARPDVVKPWAKQQPWFFDSPATHSTIDWADFTQKERQVAKRYRDEIQA